MAQHYAPEEVSGAVLATELAEGLQQRGHQVTFVTCAPNYPGGQVYPGYSNPFMKRELLNGVEVIRVWSYISPAKSFWPRILNFGTFSLMALFGGLAAGEFDLLMSYSPPLPLGIAAWVTSRVRRAPWLLRVEDLYPEAAVAAGVLRNRAVIRFFEWLEKFIYRRARHISVISESFRQNLLGKEIPAEKLSVLPVWADPQAIQPGEKENEFRQRHGLTGKFVVLYSGNLGHNSALEDVLAAAGDLSAQPEIVFVIVGEGVKKAELEAEAERRKLANVLFLPYQPRAEYAGLLAAADVSLVTLAKGSANTSLPSKTFNIMAAGRPILAVVEDSSEIARLVRGTECGVVISPQQPELLAKQIRLLQSQPGQLQWYGDNSRNALIESFGRAKVIAAYAQMLETLGAVEGESPVGQPG